MLGVLVVTWGPYDFSLMLLIVHAFVALKFDLVAVVRIHAFVALKFDLVAAL